MEGETSEDCGDKLLDKLDEEEYGKFAGDAKLLFIKLNFSFDEEFCCPFSISTGDEIKEFDFCC